MQKTAEYDKQKEPDASPVLCICVSACVFCETDYQDPDDHV